MNACGKCGGELRIEPIQTYEPKRELVGGMQVELIEGAVKSLVCEKCGEVRRVDIPDLPGMLAAVAIVRAMVPLKLNGKEIRFMRKTLELTAKDLAQRMDVSEETVSRWENDRLVIGNATERLLRLQVCRSLAESAPTVDWDDEKILYEMQINPVISSEVSFKIALRRVPLRIAKTHKKEPMWLEAA